MIAELVTICHTCGGTEKLFNCGSCKSVKYCSRDCQRADWPNHKPICKHIPPVKKGGSDPIKLAKNKIRKIHSVNNYNLMISAILHRWNKDQKCMIVCYCNMKGNVLTIKGQKSLDTINKPGCYSIKYLYDLNTENKDIFQVNTSIGIADCKNADIDITERYDTFRKIPAVFESIFYEDQLIFTIGSAIYVC